MELGIRVEDVPGLTLAVLGAASALMLVMGALVMLCGGYARRSFLRAGIAPCPTTAEYEDEDPGHCPHLANAIRAEINRCLPARHHLPMLDVRGAPRSPLVIRRRSEVSQSPPPAGASGEPPLERARRKVADAVADHLPFLSRHRLALVTVDEHGVLDDRAWRKTCRDTIDRLVRERLTETEAEALTAAGPDRMLAALLGDPGWMEWAWRATSSAYHPGLRPSEYVALCATRLRAAGWQCRPVPAGSEGADADIVARKGDITLVLRCWKTGSGIGRHLVREAITAKARLGADVAAVVSNAPFSRSAIELAHGTGTILLNHGELDVLEERLSAPSANQRTCGQAAPRVCLDAGDEIWPC